MMYLIDLSSSWLGGWVLHVTRHRRAAKQQFHVCEVAVLLRFILPVCVDCVSLSFFEGFFPRSRFLLSFELQLPYACLSQNMPSPCGNVGCRPPGCNAMLQNWCEAQGSRKCVCVDSLLFKTVPVNVHVYCHRCTTAFWHRVLTRGAGFCRDCQQSAGTLSARQPGQRQQSVSVIVSTLSGKCAILSLLCIKQAQGFYDLNSHVPLLSRIIAHHCDGFCTAE